jgi:hypothetical protein
MTVRQIVMLQIQEAKRFPSMMAHARSLIGRRFAPEETLCGRIETAVLPGAKGKPRAVQNQLIRDAQRQGLFLARLARECNARVAESDRERTLESALLHAFRLLCLRDKDGTTRAGDLLDMAQAVHRRAADLLDAVRLIEREYFDGVSILYADADAALASRVREGREFVDWAASYLEDRAVLAGRRPKNQVRQTSAAPSDTREIARGMVVVVKARVLNDLGETAAAERILDEH